MRLFRRLRLPNVLLYGALLFAAGAGALTAVSFGAATQPPAKTVTINLATGPRGPAGPPGERGPQGERGPAGPAGIACPTGYSGGRIVINHPGGQTSIWTCIAN